MNTFQVIGIILLTPVFLFLIGILIFSIIELIIEIIKYKNTDAAIGLIAVLGLLGIVFMMIGTR